MTTRRAGFAVPSAISFLLLALLLPGCPEETPSPPSDRAPEPATAPQPPHAPPSARIEGRDAGAPEQGVAGQRIWLVPAGMCAEVDFRMKKGGRVTGDFKADGKLLVDAHTHKGEQILVYGRSEGSQGAVDFKAPEDGVYSFLWEHPGKDADPPIRLEVKLVGQAEIVAWIP